MREIKLRAWNLDYKWMSHEFYINSEGVTFDEPNTHYDTPNIEIEEDPNLIVMQFTGLKDKNGVDIYEGDIVAKKGVDQNSIEYKEWMDNSDYSGSKDSILESKIPIVNAVVDVVSLDKFRYWLKNERFGYEGEDLEMPDLFEVIGNIYENPELLK